MQSAEERSRLSGRYADGETRPLATVLKCAAGIATLFAVAAGPWVVLSADGRGTAMQPLANAAPTRLVANKIRTANASFFMSQIAARIQK